ncbi:hypothetical protein [Neobacillus ginsengisoli]|uniref:Uncharacterized protein n=1 Tax=Neobacillus ginsengisoli TaxID=904295 RepID=A0ABT9Y103_9BACI|nr:hypothetical protein [Neobacillus ginsengisoli]MDQ0201497.1 hypothetical protein [Neobacillus ginsengisoli]
MSDQTYNNNRRDDQSISESVKDTAGAAFHGVHNALEATENAAMSAVDGTANAVNNLTNKANEIKNSLD